MDGIRITAQNLFSEESIASSKDRVRSLIVSKGLDLESRADGYQAQPIPGGQPQSVIRASSTLNSMEVRFQSYQNGTKIEVDHGITTIGLILGLLGLIIFLLGAIVFLIWFLKYNETKDDLHRMFPGYLPPPQQQQYGGQQSQYGGQQQTSYQGQNEKAQPTEDTSGQITPED